MLLKFKVTRVCDFDDIKTVLTESGYNVKVVHLVRDPRASTNSLTFTSGKPMDNKYKYF